MDVDDPLNQSAAESRVDESYSGNDKPATGSNWAPALSWEVELMNTESGLQTDEKNFQPRLERALITLKHLSESLEGISSSPHLYIYDMK